MAKRHVMFFLDELQEKEVIPEDEYRSGVEWIRQYYDGWYEAFIKKENRVLVFSAVLKNPDNLLSILTFVDICFEFNERDYLESILEKPKGKELFEDGIELLKLYIKRRKEYVDDDKYFQDAQTLIQKLSKDEVANLEELMEAIEFHSGEQTAEQFYNIVSNFYYIICNHS